MKILWVNLFFLHPTERGGPIRTLGILKPLHRRHEVHYAALDNPASSEGRDMAHTYSSRAYPISHRAVSRTSPAFIPQLAAHLLTSRLPLAVSRYASRELLHTVTELMRTERYDSVVCDFLGSGVNMPSVRDAVLFQHNVETIIFQRHAEHAATPVHKAFFELQARRMHAYEQRICRESKHVIAVSPVDAQRMRDMFGITSVSDVETGVDLEYFRPPAPVEPEIDFVFVGSMDWLPNIDGMLWFASEILPLLRQSKPNCTVAVVGRRPDERLKALAAADPHFTVTGTVPDVRPYLWKSRVSILPLRIGGGTRMKVYEAMAAGIPMVSTQVGMEGLACRPGRDIIVADTPGEFAAQCLALLDDAGRARTLAESARALVEERCSWDAVSRQFEDKLEEFRIPARSLTGG